MKQAIRKDERSRSLEPAGTGKVRVRVWVRVSGQKR
jgi:hypothetical protein